MDSLGKKFLAHVGWGHVAAKGLSLLSCYIDE